MQVVSFTPVISANIITKQEETNGLETVSCSCWSSEGQASYRPTASLRPGDKALLLLTIRHYVAHAAETVSFDITDEPNCARLLPQPTHASYLPKCRSVDLRLGHQNSTRFDVSWIPQYRQVKWNALWYRGHE